MKTRFLRHSLNWNQRSLDFLDSSARISAHLKSKALISNFHLLQKKIPAQTLIPMIKADGYGHGATWVAQCLVDLPGLEGFGVATLEEGARVRQALASKNRSIRILIFSGTLPWTEEKGQFCERFALTPVIASYEDWTAFWKQGWARRIPYELKFNTGMNRLGIELSFASSIIQQLKPRGSRVRLPVGVLSHLAIAEDPTCRISRLQRKAFESLRREWASVFQGIRFHLGNSAAIFHQEKWNLSELTESARPGIALYGIPPWPQSPEKKLQSVATVKAPVIAIRDLGPGEGLGYGVEFKIPLRSRQKKRVAILAAGYADGVHRLLGSGNAGRGKGFGILAGQKVSFLGRVSMDLCAVECPPQTRLGDWVEIVGPHVNPWEQAQAAGTIPYEVLTSLSSRVQRIYDQS